VLVEGWFELHQPCFLRATEKIKTELRLQAYNATNTPHFGQPNSNFSDGNFGQITTTLPFTYRQVELGLRVTC
jgi:hypothetical protein